MNATELKNLVSKITQARKIQKAKIDNQSDLQRLEDESISKLQAPVIQEISTQGAKTQRSLFNQSTAARKAIELQEKQLKQLEQFPRVMKSLVEQGLVEQRPKRLPSVTMEKDLSENDDSSQEFKSPEKNPLNSPERLEPLDMEKPVQSVQNFYKTYRKQNKSKTTQFEVNLDSEKIGENAKVDIAELFNNNNLVITFERVGRKKFPKEALTPGFLSLLLLPYSDMSEMKIKPTKKDLDFYVSTMKYADFSKSTSSKYKKYVQPYVETPKKTTGKGLFVYKHPRELEDRLSILIGSLHAGNNSSKVKSQVRSIVDKLLELGNLTPALHKKFFVKYSL